MKRGFVVCSTIDGPVEVSALLTEHIAVHKSLIDAKPAGKRPTDWTLTHRSSGLALTWCDSRRQAHKEALRIESEASPDLKLLASLNFGRSPSKRGRQGVASKRLAAVVRR